MGTRLFIYNNIINVITPFKFNIQYCFDIFKYLKYLKYNQLTYMYFVEISEVSMSSVKGYPQNNGRKRTELETNEFSIRD